MGKRPILPLLILLSAAASTALAKEPAQQPDPAAASPGAPPPREEAAALVQRAREALARHAYKEARGLADHAMKLDGDNLDARYAFAVSAQKLGQLRTARVQLSALRQRDPTRPGVTRLLAETCEGLKDPQQAAALFLAAAREEKDPSLNLRAARIAFGAGLWKLACEGFKDARSLESADLQKYAQAAEKAARWAEAAAADRALLQQTGDEQWQLPLTSALIHMNDLPGAETAVNAVLSKDSNNASALLLAADIAHARQDAASEEKLTRTAISASPRIAGAHRRLGDLAFARNATADAQAAYEAELSVTPDDPGASAGLARIAAQNGNIEAAVGYARKALQSKAADAADPALNALLGHLLLSAGDCRGALGPLRTAAHAESNEAALDLAECLHVTGADAAARQSIAQVEARDPRQPRAHELAGVIALAHNEKATARRELDSAVANGANDLQLVVRVAQDYAAAGDGAAAETLAQRVLQSHPEDVEASRLLADIEVKRGELARALPLLATVEHAHPGDVHVLAALARVHRAAAQGRPGAEEDQARQYAARALAARADDPEANEINGLLALDATPAALTGKADGQDARAAIAGLTAARARARAEAEAYFEKALQGRPGGEALAAVAQARREAGKRKEAQELLSRVREEPIPDDVALAQAALALDDGDLKSAEEELAAVLLAHPGNGEGQALAGDIASERGDSEMARSHYQAADATGALTPAQKARYAEALAAGGTLPLAATLAREALQGGESGAGVHATLGWVLYRQGDKDGSRAELNIAEDKGAHDKNVHVILGTLAQEEGDFPKAQAEFEKALAIAPDDPAANAAEGRILTGQKKYAAALPHLRKAWATNSHDAELGVALARTYLGVGDATTEAAGVLDQLSPGAVDEATLHTLRGQIAAQRGNHVRAASEYEKAVQAKPGDPDILQLQAQNLLDVPQYEKAIAALEEAQKHAPDRVDIARELARLYAATEQPGRAADAQARAELAEETGIEKQRKTIPPEQVKIVAVADEFQPVGDMGAGGANYAYIGKVLPDGIAHDLARSPYIRLLARDARTQAAAEKQKETWLKEHPDATPEEVEAGIGGLTPQATYVVAGQYVVIPAEGDQPAQLQVSAKLVEVKGQAILRSSSRHGELKDFSQVQHAVALELLGQFVPITESERAAIEKAVPVGNLESMRLMVEARDATAKGDLRSAQALLRAARAADEHNVAAIADLQRTQKELGPANRVAVRDFARIGTAPDYIETGLQNTITSKLANVGGIQVIERSELPAIEKEVELWLAQHADAQGAGTAAENAHLQEEVQQMTSTVPVGAVVSGSFQLANGVLVIEARMIDWGSKSVMLAERVAGPEKSVLDLENELAEKIVRRLVGAPSEEETRRLREKQDFEQYKRDMEELTRRRAAEKNELVAETSTPETTPAAASAPGTSTAAGESSKEPVPKDTVWVDIRGQGLGQKNGPPAFGLALGLLSWDRKFKGLPILSGEELHLTWIVGGISNRLTQSRTYNYAPVSVYETGLDVDSTWWWKFIGLDLGMAVTGGLHQNLILEETGTTVNQFWLGARLRVGLALRLENLRFHAAIGGQAGWTPTADPNGATVNGLFLQTGLAYQFGEAPELPTGFELAYRAHTVLPTGSDAFRSYGGYFGQHGGFMLQNELLIGKGSGRFTHSAVLGVGYAPDKDPTAGVSPFVLAEFGYDFQVHFFAEHHLVNPLAGLRFSLVRASGGGLGDTCGTSSSGCWGFMFGPQVGVDIDPITGLGFRIAAGHDFLWSPIPSAALSSAGDYSGYTADIGISYRF
jgi:tetratricopeptide (TPR) repeat protein